MTNASAPITLEDVLIHSAKLTEELGTVLRTAARIESALTGYPPAPSDEDPPAPMRAGFILGLHENLCELSQKVSAVSSVLGGIEDRLAAPKVAVALPFPPSVLPDPSHYGGPVQPVVKR